MKNNLSHMRGIKDSLSSNFLFAVTLQKEMSQISLLPAEELPYRKNI